MFNILMSMSVLGCGGVYSAADCGQQTRPGTTEAGLGGGRADGQKAGPGPATLWSLAAVAGAEDVREGAILS